MITNGFKELDLVKNAIYTDPEDQSAWLYYWWLLGKAPEYVSLLGAYRLEDTSLIVIGFNDIVKFTHTPQLFDADNNHVSMKLFSLSSEDSESSSLWAILPDNDKNATRIEISSNTILPSRSSKLVVSNETWSTEIKRVHRGKYNRIIKR